MTLENEPGVRHGSPVEGGHMRYFFYHNNKRRDKKNLAYGARGLESIITEQKLGGRSKS